MTMNEMLFGFYKQFYDEGIYHLSNLQLFVSIGTLSLEGYKQITGQDYLTGTGGTNASTNLQN